MKKKKSNKKCLPNLYPHTHTHTKKAKSWGYADFKMAANENALRNQGRAMQIENEIRV